MTVNNSDQPTERHEPISRPRRSAWARCWPWLRRFLTLAFFAAVGWLLVRQAQSLDWDQVAAGLRNYTWPTIVTALALSACAFSVYACYDLFGRHFVDTKITKIRTMAVAFIAFAFNLNLGALVGSVGIRYRLYTQLGLGKAQVAHIVGMTVTTNWLGYLFLAGVAFTSGTVDVPLDWHITNPALRIVGAVFILVTVAYLLLCRFSPRRVWSIRDHELRLPSMSIAWLQLGTASAHWLLMGSVMYSFLHTEVGFIELLGVLLVSSVAGAIAHIPGALGVLETVFVVFLGDDLSPSQIIAALIAYRAVFYLAPLSVAVAVYLYMETVVTGVQSDS